MSPKKKHEHAKMCPQIGFGKDGYSQRERPLGDTDSPAKPLAPRGLVNSKLRCSAQAHG